MPGFQDSRILQYNSRILLFQGDAANNATAGSDTQGPTRIWKLLREYLPAGIQILLQTSLYQPVAWTPWPHGCRGDVAGTAALGKERQERLPIINGACKV